MIRLFPENTGSSFERVTGSALAVLFLIALIAGCDGSQTDSSSQAVNSPPTNWQRHDRSHDRLALDHGRNILDSCAMNAVLFTQGDNDTYPLWYLQEVKGYRRDVSVVNISILSASWYIKQLRDGSLPLLSGITDDFIDRRLTGGLTSYTTLRWPPDSSETAAAGIHWNMPPTWRVPDGSFGMLSAAHFLIVRIIDEVNWSQPIYFSTAVTTGNRIGLDPYLVYEGLVYRLTPGHSENDAYRIDTTQLVTNITDIYRLDSIFDSTVYKSPDTMNILHDYFTAYVILMEEYAHDGDMTAAISMMHGAQKIADGHPLWLRYLTEVQYLWGFDTTDEEK